MRTDRMRESENVEDRRGMGPKMAVGGGIGGLGLIIIIVYALMGGNPQQLLQNLPQSPAPGPVAAGGRPGAGVDPANDQGGQFVRRVLGDTEDVWNEVFRRQVGSDYPEPTLVLFTAQVQSACGNADAAVGPFYCPGDQKIYIDLSFYDELSRRFGAPGDFAQAYVIAHEVGHHVQNVLGISGKVDQMRGRVSEREMNDLSVRLELQADYLAGVWAHHAHQSRAIIESGDVEEAIRCAQAIGDDKLQMQARGYVVPDSFTHGTSAQRAKWFKKGLESGDINGGDTFSVENP